MNISIGEASLLLGVSISTLRRWEKNGKLKSDFRTLGGHRRYIFAKLKSMKNPVDSSTDHPKSVVAYARVSSSDQKGDLIRQKERLQEFCASQGWQALVIEDLGSGLNYKKNGFRKLFRMILRGEVSTLVLTHKDRLLRFGSEIIFDLCEIMGTKVMMIDENSKISDDEMLAKDVLELMTVFAARLHGRRSHAHKKLQAA